MSTRKHFSAVSSVSAPHAGIDAAIKDMVDGGCAGGGERNT